MWYDITRTVNAATAVWPGDHPFHAAHALRIPEGSSVNLTTITMSPHTGTHADAYYHYEQDGEHPAHMPLEKYIGRARVITVSRRDGALTLDDVAHISITGAERVLIRSAVSEAADDAPFPTEFPYLSVPLIDAWAAAGIVLIGLDSPSVDAFTSRELPCHHALRRQGMVNLENLALRGVPDGDYELIALPLKLDAVCGSPVRAILRPLNR
ncbi:MAG: cyclase family protein [bacterium]|nr:cyclase family protein [bacterium]